MNDEGYVRDPDTGTWGMAEGFHEDEPTVAVPWGSPVTQGECVGWHALTSRATTWTVGAWVCHPQVSGVCATLHNAAWLSARSMAL